MLFMSLKEVDLSHSRLKIIPSILTSLTKIKVLTLRQNLLKDITPLLKLDTLTDLDLYDNEIAVIPDLSRLTKLQ